MSNSAQTEKNDAPKQDWSVTNGGYAGAEKTDSIGKPEI